MPAAVDVASLTRTYRTSARTVVALDRLDLTIAEGTITGILGENGAGKTTLAKILSTLLLPSSGRARVFGYDVVAEAREVRALTTAVFGGDRGLYPMLSGRENLRYFAAVHGVRPSELRRRGPELLASAGLADAADRRVETYSKGMRQRLHICIGLLTRPRLLLLDEPTVGLDPAESARLRTVISGFPAEGTTVLLTSHNLLDVEQLAERVVMLARGRIAHDLGVAQFRRLSGREAVVSVTVEGAARLTDALRALGARPGSGASALEIPVARWSSDVLRQLSAALDGQTITDLDVRSTTLDDAFAAAAGATGAS